MLVSSCCMRRVGTVGVKRSCGGIGHLPDAWVERARAITPRHLGQWNDPDLRGVARGTELLKALAAEVAQRGHRGFQELTRVEFAFALRCHFAKGRRHRQPAVGVDIDLADAVLDAADDFLDRHPPGLRHLAAERVERVCALRPSTAPHWPSWSSPPPCSSEPSTPSSPSTEAPIQCAMSTTRRVMAT